MEKNNYNPDVLNCIANLSNDEVFTPPALANQMLDLLPKELFGNAKTKFLDPFCKSGVFLREIVKRLDEGLAAVMPNREERITHILKHQVYGIAITELTALLSRRSAYCSKDANGKHSVVHFDHSEGNVLYSEHRHTWQNGKCLYCGASEEIYDREGGREQYAYQFIHTDNPEKFFNMDFDVIIGNPPYQMSDGGHGASATPLYHLFVQQAMKLNPKYLCMIIPARWYAGGKGSDLESFRNRMLKYNNIRCLCDIPDSSDCFPGVEIKGGVCFFLWDKDYNGDADVMSFQQGKLVSSMKRKLFEDGCDTFIRHNGAVSIVRKVGSFKEKTFADLVHPAMTFGIRCYVKDFDRKTPADGYVKVYAQKTIGYIKEDKITEGKEFIAEWKVIIPEAVGSGIIGRDVLKPILCAPNTINTETYIMNGPYVSQQEAENAISYIKTKFFHFMLGLKKITQHTTQKVYSLIPLQDFSKPWTDAELYAKYGLDEEEIAFIESMIKPMDEKEED